MSKIKPHGHVSRLGERKDFDDLLRRRFLLRLGRVREELLRHAECLGHILGLNLALFMEVDPDVELVAVRPYQAVYGID